MLLVLHHHLRLSKQEFLVRLGWHLGTPNCWLD